MTPKYLTPADVHEEFGIGRSHLNQLVAAGRIKPAFDPGRPGSARLYTAAAIRKYLASRDNRGKRHPEPNGGAE